MNIGDSEDFDYDKEDEENDWLRTVSQAENPRLFTGMDFSECYCDVCGCEILRNEEHFHCFECKDFDECIKCYSLGKIHFHGKQNFLYKMTEPNWYFPIRILDDDERTVSSVIMDCFNFYEERHFVGQRASEQDEDFTWYRFGQVRDMMMRLAKSMKNDLELKKGDMISILCNIRLEPIVIWFSCMYLGITFVPLQNILSVEEKKYILSQTEVKAVFCCGEEQVKEVRAISKECKSIQSIIIIPNNSEEAEEEEEEEEGERLLSTPKEFIFSDLCKETTDTSESDLPPRVEHKPEDIICIIYTSGTTGFPKGIVFRERIWLSKLTRKELRNPLVIFSFLPFSHLSGIVDPLLAFFNGGRTGLLTFSNMNFLFDDFKILRPTILSTIPRVLNFVYAEYQRRVRVEIKSIVPGDGDGEGKRIECEEKVKKEMKHVFGDRLPEITVGSAHCSNKVKRMVREICQIPVYDGYGITEVGAVSYNYKASPDVDIQLLDCPELGYYSTDKPYPRGELLVRNKTTLSLEYFKNQEVSRKKFDKDGYFHTGDIVEKRGDRIILIDRKHNIIKMGQGEFVSLENIEKVLETSDYIDQIVLTPTSGNTHLLGLVTVLPSRWEDLKSSSKSSEEEIVMMDIESVGKKNGMNSWEFPSSVRLIYDKFPLTELKKKNRRKILKKYEGLVTEMKMESEDGTINSTSSTTTETSDIEELMKNLGIRVELEEVRKKTLRELGVQSFTGTVLRNQIEQVFGVKLSFSELMTRSISQILELSSVRILCTKRREEKKKYINLEEEEEKFKKFMDDEIRILDTPSQISTKEQFEKWITYPRSILLTGATGFLGQCLLDKLLLEYPETTIICLVRTSSASLLFGSRDENRIIPLHGDLSQSFLGLESEEKFNEIQNLDIDMIVHCGAMVNHFADYQEHYESNVRSLYDLVRISKGWKPFVYISSVSIFHSYLSRIMSSADEALENQDFPFENGYEGSKWVTDCLVRKFLPSSSLVIRPNLIFGDTRTGRCNLKDWMTAIIYSCLDTKSVLSEADSMKVPLNMLPVNIVTDSMVQMMKDVRMYGKDGKNISFSNVTVGKLMNLIILSCKEETMEKVSWKEWIHRLGKRVDEKGGNHQISPFLVGLARSGRIGSSKDLKYDMSNYHEVYRKQWRKTSPDDMKKYVEYVSKYLIFISSEPEKVEEEEETEGEKT